MTKKGSSGTNVPRLRFKEFLEAGEWEYFKGNNIFDQINNRNHNSDFPILAITQEQGAIPRNQINYNVVVTEKSVESYKLVEVGDFIISLRSFQGGIEYSNYKGICSPAYIILRRIKNGSDLFFKHYFKTVDLISNLNRNIEGIRDGKMVSFKQFSDLLIPCPSYHEQQKIAETLSSLDDLLAAHNEKLEALKQYKKGLMQVLFPAASETVPRLRFKEFLEEWVEDLFEDIYSFKGTNSLSREKLNYVNGLVKNIHYGDIHKSFNNLFDITNEIVPFINIDVAIDKFKEVNFCVAGDLIFADASEDLKDIGKCIEVIKLDGQKIISGLHTLLARQKGKKLILGFAGHLFMSNQIRLQIQTIAQGTKVLGLSNGRLLKIKIIYPIDQKEQQKIISTLSTLDALISNQTKKIEALKTHKKGMMQGLFPTQI